METPYPWDETVNIEIMASGSSEWGLRLRIPQWCSNAELRLNGQVVDIQPVDGSVTVRRVWKAGDQLSLRLPMAPQLTAGHPYVDSARDCVTLEYGPLVYCVEAVDLPAGSRIQEIQLDPHSSFEPTRREDLLEGTITIDADGYALNLESWSGQLYRPYQEANAITREPLPLRFIPYHQWANRGPSPMRVWIPLG